MPSILPQWIVSSLLLLLLLLLSDHGVSSYEDITSEEMYEGIQSGRWDVIIDVRRGFEWVGGHVPGATHVESLQLVDLDAGETIPSILDGCETCTIVVYCNSGARASLAAQVLEAAGFATPVYNGQGVVQWGQAGYELVGTPSVVPPCNNSPTGICNAGEFVLEQPSGSLAPSPSPSLSCLPPGQTCISNTECCTRRCDPFRGCLPNSFTRSSRAKSAVSLVPNTVGGQGAVAKNFG